MISVGRLSVAPVKGLALQHPDSIDLSENGVPEDRRFFLIDETGRLVDGLIAAELVRVEAWADPGGTCLRLSLPDGTAVDADVRTAEAIETRMYGRTVLGHVVEGPWAPALAALAGRPIRLIRTDAPGGTRAQHQASLVSDGSLGRLGDQLGVGAVDGRRFRMLIELLGGADHEEDTWIGGRVAVGDVVLRISGPIPRCAITTHDPDSGERDLDTLRAIREYRGLRNGKDLDFGVYGEIERPGRIAVGDELAVL
ncbi:MAG: MOSC domain-containing protein [Candidatus Limnocylindrales bacterium]